MTGKPSSRWEHTKEMQQLNTMNDPELEVYIKKKKERNTIKYIL